MKSNKLITMFCDSHIHIGQFFDIYTSPRKLLTITKKIGIDHFAVSSTTICEENYTKVLHELEALVRMGKDRVVPVLWITPMMVDNELVINAFLESGINWRCVKIHSGLHPHRWKPYSKYMKKAISIAKKLRVPLLFHTGEFPCCEPNYYRKLIEKHRQQTFILAHSRPVDQTISIMREYKNVWADTAFTPMGDIKLMVDTGLIDRMMWGTDLPVMQHFLGEADKEYDFVSYYNELKIQLHKILSDEEYIKLTYINFCRLFQL